MKTSNILTGSGGKGGGSVHVPKESPNTLASKATARTVEILSEGEIQGLVNADPLKSLYFDNIPVKEDNGTLNYKGVSVTVLAGLPDQPVIPGFSDVESLISVGKEIKHGTPEIFTVTNSEVTAVRITLGVPALSQVLSNGDLVGTLVELKIYRQLNGGAYTLLKTVSIRGKTTSDYERQIRVSVEAANVGQYPVNFKVERITADSTTVQLQNQTFLNSYTEIIESQFTYPNTAIAGVTVDAQLFNGRVPRRSFDIRGIKVKVPTGYDPIARTYPGFWNGTFTVAWTDNPAWILYDLLTNRRYGLGQFINSTQVDVASLYQISQYCDELVSDGKGGTEPRFTFNTVIAERQEAYDVINAVCSVFRGMPFWSAGGVSVAQDSPKQTTRIINQASVVDGLFTYSGTSLKARHTAALVTWNDPSQHYKQVVELVEDADSIIRYGFRSIELSAFACTSKGQAHRLGRWLLDSERNENETITFSGGYDLVDLRPGDIIETCDPGRQATRQGGRIVSSSGTAIVLDSPYAPTTGENIHLMDVNGNIQTLALVASSASTTVTVTSAPSATLQPNTLYNITGVVFAEKWRVLSVSEREPHIFDITGLRYDPTKYARVEQNLLLPAAPTTFFPSGPLLAPTNLSFREVLFRINNSTVSRVDIFWTGSTDARVFLYKVEAKPPDEDWIPISVTSNLSASISNAKAGLWSFRVSALRTNDPASLQSDYIVLEDQEIFGKTAPPGNVAGLSATRTFNNTVLQWTEVDDLDLAGYEIRVGSDWSTSTLLISGVVGSRVVVSAETVLPQRYLIKAFDELGIYSELVDSADTVFPTVPPASDLRAYQTGSVVQLYWNPAIVNVPIRYEVRRGTAAQTWEQSLFIDSTLETQFSFPLSVESPTDFRFRVKAYIEWNGARAYSSEVTRDMTKFAVVGANLVFSRIDHPTWAGTKSASMEVVSNVLRLKSNETFGTYRYQITLPTVGGDAPPHRGRLFRVDLPGYDSFNALLVDDLAFEVNDWTDFISPTIIGLVPNVRYFLEFPTELEWVEADYDLTSVWIRVEFSRNPTDQFVPTLSALSTYFNLPTEMP